MGILEYLPFLLWTVKPFLVLKGFPCSSKVDRISDILLFRKNIGNSTCTPVKRSDRRFAAISADAIRIFRWRHYLGGFQLFCYLRRT